MGTHDIYSFGVVSSSTLYLLDGSFPNPDGYAEIGEVRHWIGGEAANSSIVLARLGATVKLDGNWIGDDDPGRRTRSILEDIGIDMSRLPLRPDYQGVSENVFSAEGSRTIFATYGHLHEERAWNQPDAADIAAAKVVCLDPFFGDASRNAAQLAADAAIPFVTVDCRSDDPILKHAAAVVVSHVYLDEHYPGAEPEELMDEYQATTAGLVVFTYGEREILFGRRGESLFKQLL